MNTTLQYTGMYLDRGDALRRCPETLDRLWNNDHCHIIPVFENLNLFTLMPNDDKLVEAIIPSRIDLSEFLEKAKHKTFLGVYDDIPYFSLEIHQQCKEALTNYVDGQFTNLRNYGPQLNKSTAALLAYARALTHWQLQNRFCAFCRSPLNASHGGHVLECSGSKSEDKECKLSIYPRTDPAVIMLVERVNKDGTPECLLGRQAQWPHKAFSTLAGFVEPGESLEEAVRREVLEEAGIKTGSVRYIGSQPWPFPASIMLGFIAKATSSEITIDTHELAEAHWFSKADLESFGEWRDDSDNFKHSPQDSISRFLVEYWMNSQS